MVLQHFILGLAFSLILTPIIAKIARKYGILDKPDGDRKNHKKAVPLLGGTAIFLAFVIAASFATKGLFGGFLLPKHLIGIVLGSMILVIGGALDDIWNLKPSRQILFPIAAALVIIASGIGATYITNPFGGVLRLDLWQIPVFTYGGNPYHISLPGDLFTFVWLMVMMYTTKLLDGLDGLVSGLGIIGFTVIALLSLTPEVAQPELARLSMIAAGAVGGFLFYNGFPASIFLGEGGSTLVGFLLGTLAILSGGKIGITLLVLAVPLIDVAWTIFRRLVLERKSVASADVGHLHFRLRALGLSHRETVAVFWLFAAGFGGTGLFLRGREKALAFVLLAAVFILVTVFLHRVLKKKDGQSRNN